MGPTGSSELATMEHKEWWNQGGPVLGKYTLTGKPGPMGIYSGKGYGANTALGYYPWLAPLRLLYWLMLTSMLPVMMAYSELTPKGPVQLWISCFLCTPLSCMLPCTHRNPSIPGLFLLPLLFTRCLHLLVQYILY